MPYGSDGIWRERYDVHTFDLDARVRLSPQAACNFLIDTAGHNADALGFSVPQLLEQQRTWFLSRLMLRLRDWPGWRARLEVQTWPSGFRKLFALRQWRLLHEGRQIGEAASAWLMIDHRTRRPIRPQTLATWGEHIRDEQALEHDFAALPEPDGPAAPAQAGVQEHTVRFGDVDINGHAGYLAYVDWVLETVPAEIRSRRRLTELEIHYVAELSQGQTVGARAAPYTAAPGTAGYLHLLTCEGREACRARTLWIADPSAT